jgi:starch synthase (maltosyl-transferring)
MLYELLQFIKTTSLNHRIPAYWYELADLPADRPVQEFYEKQISSYLARGASRPSYRPDEMKMIQLFLHHFTSYDHYPGTLLKSLAVLPLLAHCGFNSIMLLPHFLRSRKFMKGDSGSPYAVQDYYTIDCEINLLEGFPTDSLFKAFVEACHRLGMLVFLDMVPRTAARDSLWILENPDWLYWIRPEDSDRLIDLLQTEIPGLPHPAFPDPDSGRTMIRHLPIREIAEIFKYSPKVEDPVRWENFSRHHRGKQDFLDELVNEFGVITPPSTSDCANDPQPPWRDVTPLRLFKDYAPAFYEICGKTLLEDNAPFFCQPVLKASAFKGERPIQDLWEKIAGVCSYYAREYELDGVRGDMFHALPAELIKLLVGKVPDGFIFIMENLDNDEGARLSLEHGFHFYTGNLFTAIEEGRESMDFFLRQVTNHQTMIIAMPVIGDSRPLFSRRREKALFQIALAAFLPNSCFGITADTLLENDIPLNFGLGFSEKEQKDFQEIMAKRGRQPAYFFHDYLTECWDSMDNTKLKFIRMLIKLRDSFFTGKCWRLDHIVKSEGDKLIYSLAFGNERLYVAANFSSFETFNLPLPQGQVYPFLSSYSKGQNLYVGPYGLSLWKW